MKYEMEQPVQASIGVSKYQCNVQWRNGNFISDEPVTAGGKDEGPDPFTLLLASLATCTIITLRMYIDRKAWDIPEIDVQTNLFKYTKDGETVTVFDRDIRFGNEVTDEQRERLTDIAKACPISKIIAGKVDVRTYVYTEKEIEKQIKYNNKDITVVWKPELCKHSGRCVTQLPGVFNLQQHPWINMEGATTAEIKAQVLKCPTGALSVKEKNENS